MASRWRVSRPVGALAWLARAVFVAVLGVVLFSCAGPARASGTVSGGGGTGTGYFFFNASPGTPGAVGCLGSCSPSFGIVNLYGDGLRYSTPAAACSSGAVGYTVPSGYGAAQFIPSGSTCVIRFYPTGGPSPGTCNNYCGGATFNVASGTGPLAATCPANSSGTTTCTCNTGYSPNAGATACVSATCTTQSLAASGYFDVGATAGTSPVMLGCNADCEVVFDGISPSGNALVGGVKHYYAKGSYIRTGATCTGGAGGAKTETGAGVSTVPADTCPSGQVMAQVNGQGVCVVQSTGAASAPTGQETTGSKSTTTSSTTTVTNGDGSKTTTTTTTTTYSDGSKDTTIKTENTPSGGTTPTSSTTTNEKTGPPGSIAQQLPGGTGTATDPNAEPDVPPCDADPTGAGCIGTAATVGDPRAEGARTVSDALTAFKNGVMGTALGSAASGFFTVSAGGSCPTWSWTVPYLDETVAFDAQCASWAITAYALLKAAILCLAAFLAFRVAFE